MPISDDEETVEMNVIYDPNTGTAVVTAPDGRSFTLRLARGLRGDQLEDVVNDELDRVCDAAEARH